MQRWGHNFRFLAVSALVVLALTGFSTGSHGSTGGGGKVSKSKSGSSRGSKSRSGGGGGCSSSSQDHDTSHADTYDDDYDSSYNDSYDDSYDDSYGSSSGSEATETATGMPQQDAIVTLMTCASKKRPYATVQLHNPNDQDGTFDLTISFLDAKGRLIDAEKDDVDVPANETVTVKEYVGGKAASVARCKVPDLAAPAG